MTPFGLPEIDEADVEATAKGAVQRRDMRLIQRTQGEKKTQQAAKAAALADRLWGAP